MGSSRGGEPPMVVGAMVTLEEAAVYLGLGAISPAKFLRKIESLEAFMGSGKL